MKRNTAEYDAAGRISKDEVKELIEFVEEFEGKAADWLKKHHP